MTRQLCLLLQSMMQCRGLAYLRSPYLRSCLNPLAGLHTRYTLSSYLQHSSRKELHCVVVQTSPCFAVFFPPAAHLHTLIWFHVARGWLSDSAKQESWWTFGLCCMQKNHQTEFSLLTQTFFFSFHSGLFRVKMPETFQWFSSPNVSSLSNKKLSHSPQCEGVFRMSELLLQKQSVFTEIDLKVNVCSLLSHSYWMQSAGLIDCFYT